MATRTALPCVGQAALGKGYAIWSRVRFDSDFAQQEGNLSFLLAECCCLHFLFRETAGLLNRDHS